MEKETWKKAPENLVEKFGSVLPGPPAEPRKMFGYPAAFMNGNMFMGLFADRFFVRLPEEERERLLRTKGWSLLEPMTGRPMKEYVVIPDDVLRNSAKLRGFVDKSVAYAKTLPAKSKSKAKAKSKSRAKPK